MTPEQLAALLSAGLITLAQHNKSLAALSTQLVPDKPVLELQLDAQNVQLSVDDDGSVHLSGDITEYDKLLPSHGLSIDAGALEPRSTNLSDIKMLRDHDQSQPVGYMTSVDAARQHATFRIAPTEAARVQQEFTDKLRDGLSIGFHIGDYSFDDKGNLNVHQGTFHEVSLCALPAAVNARVTDVAAALATAKKENTIMNRAQLAAALAAGTITQEQHDSALAAIDAIDLATKPSPQNPVTTDPATLKGPELVKEQPSSAHLTITDRPKLSLKDAARQVSDAALAGDFNAFLLALTDIIPSADAGTAFLNRDDWLGELFTAAQTTRPWIDAFGVPAELTSLKGKGWRWTEKPQPASYAGNKGAVPSNAVTTESDEYVAQRWAGGWDIDRAFIDFADPGFTLAFFQAAMAEYLVNSNAGMRTNATAAATAGAAVASGGVLAVLKALYADIRLVLGGKLDRIFLGETLFSDFLDIPWNSMPIWLKQALVDVDPASGAAQTGQTLILVDPVIDALTAYGFDHRGIVIREKSPIQIQAQNIPNGGVDLGFFSYTRFEQQDPRLAVSRAYTGD